MPIVTAYEDTPGGHDALVLGVQLARLTGLTAVVATVYPTDGLGYSAVARDPRWRDKAEEVALARFGRARELIGGNALPEFAPLGPGPAATVLAEYAEESGAAVLVVGSTGGGLLGRLAPGSTVHRLLPAARCPVAIAPRGYRHTAAQGITVITVAYDGTPEADRATVLAVHLAGRTGAALRFAVVAASEADVPAATEIAHKGIAQAPTEIDALTDVVVSRPGQSVGATLADLSERTDLLVVGSRGYPTMRRILLGGVAGVLVRSARYPVIVVPAPD
ncbi:universal stress protein [Pseudonocardia oroxyli]|uniref:Nucleotide-binding universal stress protein, UspA family n=1 Tax=Pseudonocardia oroxyli TaxID=366584 RepID=A0A1G7JWS1_PSEOR|nr:universal stress protein [Pseudonocardia oroxyli]SDF29376.1 Nucleotide-binding universal stress protein, UspA family [Pseudonocardia oroxyli]